MHDAGVPKVLGFGMLQLPGRWCRPQICGKHAAMLYLREKTREVLLQ